jgi:hypothetical protein
MCASVAEDAGADAEHETATRHVIEEDRAIGHPERIVVRQRHDAGSQLDVGGLAGDPGAEHLR